MEESRLCVYRQIVFHIWVTNSQLRGLAGMEKAEKQKSTNHEARERKISYFFFFFFWQTWTASPLFRSHKFSSRNSAPNVIRLAVFSSTGTIANRWNFNSIESSWFELLSFEPLSWVLPNSVSRSCHIMCVSAWHTLKFKALTNRTWVKDPGNWMWRIGRIAQNMKLEWHLALNTNANAS